MTTISSILDRCLYELNSLADCNSLGQTPEVSPLQWQDELGRLRVWSGNVGAHKTSLSSLDYRLRDSSHIRNEIMKLLLRMFDLFQDLREVMSEEDNPKEELALSEEGNLEELALDESPDLTEVQQIYHSVIDIINFLFQISMAIRQPSGHDLLLSVKIRDASSFEASAKQYILHKYPGADDYLVDRLSASMARQQAVLKYREKHHQTLSQGLFSHTENRTNKLSDTVTTDTNDQLQFSDMASNSGVSQTLYAPGLLNSRETISIPPVPKVSANRTPFECPYCYRIITVGNNEDWSQHILHDLMPYVCVLDHCPCPSRPYNSRQEWYHHLVEVHSLQFNPSSDFICPLCKSSMQSVMYERHLGRHLEELGLLVLPPIDTEDKDILSNKPSHSSWIPSEERNLKTIQESEGADGNPKDSDGINQINQNDPEAESPEYEIEESAVEEPAVEEPKAGSERLHNNPRSQSQNNPFLEMGDSCLYFCVSSCNHLNLYVVKADVKMIFH